VPFLGHPVHTAHGTVERGIRSLGHRVSDVGQGFSHYAVQHCVVTVLERHFSVTDYV